MKASTLVEVMDKCWSDELPFAASCNAPCSTHAHHDNKREWQVSFKHSWHLREDGKTQSGGSINCQRFITHVA